MKKGIILVYVLTIILSLEFLAGWAMKFSYSAFESISILKGNLIYLIISLSIAIISLIIFFTDYHKINKTNFYKYLLLFLSILFLIAFIIFYPQIRIFFGSNLLILCMAFAFVPAFTLSYILIYKEINLSKSKIKKMLSRKKPK